MAGQDYRLALPAVIVMMVACSPLTILPFIFGGALATLLFGLVIGKRYPVIGRTVVLGGVCALCSVTTSFVWGTSAASSPLGQAQRTQTLVVLHGTVASHPMRSARGLDFILRTQTVTTGHDTHRQESIVRVKLTDRIDLRRYDSVVITGKMEEPWPGDFCEGLIKARNVSRIGSAHGWYTYVGQVHRALVNFAQSTRTHDDALIPGVALGDDSLLPRRIKDAMRSLGLSHLTAVSGAHVSLTIGLALMMIGQRWRYLAGGGALCATYILTTFVSPEPSVTRAVMMGCLLSIGIGLRYCATALPLLCLTVIYASLTDPRLVRSLGFQLSTVAVAAIVIGGAPLRNHLTTIMPRPIAEAIAIPFLAGIATVPLLINIQETVSVLSIIANAIVAPVIAPLTILGLGGGIIAPLLPAFGTILLSISGLCTWWIGVVVENLPTLTLPTLLSALTNVAIISLVLIIAKQLRKREIRHANVGY